MTTHQSAGIECGAGDEQSLTFKAYPNRETHLGALQISRALPIRERRMVGPWCFLDRFGPLNFKDERPMSVPPHPHIGLQTVTWLLEGEALHTDSLNSEAVILPGGVNVMTAGQGIAHAEETPLKNSGRLSGVQLWVALLDEHRHIPPAFTSVMQVPLLEIAGCLIKLFAGTYHSMTTSTAYFSELLGMEVEVHARQSTTLELNPQFEHAVLLLDGDCVLEAQPLLQKTLYDLGTCRESLDLNSHSGGRLLLIGGLPFPEKILMWWNFVARTPEELSQARADWEAHRRFGEVRGTQLERLSAPDLAHVAQPNPIS